MTNPNYYKNVNLEYQPVNTSLDKDNNTAQNNYSIRKKQQAEIFNPSEHQIQPRIHIIQVIMLIIKKMGKEN